MVSVHTTRQSCASCMLHGGTLNFPHSLTHSLRVWAGDAYQH